MSKIQEEQHCHYGVLRFSVYSAAIDVMDYLFVQFVGGKSNSLDFEILLSLSGFLYVADFRAQSDSVFYAFGAIARGDEYIELQLYYKSTSIDRSIFALDDLAAAHDFLSRRFFGTAPHLSPCAPSMQDCLRRHRSHATFKLMDFDFRLSIALATLFVNHIHHCCGGLLQF